MRESSPSGGQGKGGDSSPPTQGRSAAKNSGAKSKQSSRLTPEAITSVAMRIADADGLEAVSIRRVASELETGPMSLYTHFPSKHELLSAMTNEAVAEMLVEQPLSEDWREAVSAIARRMHGSMSAHPWLAFIFSQRPRPGPDVIRHAKQMARAMANLPLAPAEAWTVQGIVNDYVLGYSFRTVTGADADDLEEAISGSDVVEFPELASLPETVRSRAALDRFELGLQTVLDGVERRFLEGGKH